MELKLNDLMNKFDYIQEIRKEKEYLEELKNIIDVFFGIITREKDKTLLFLNKYEFGKILNFLIDFINKNSVKIGKKQVINKEIDIFVNLISYLGKRRNIGNLLGFEKFMQKNIDDLDQNSKDDIFKFIGEGIFWRKVSSEIMNFIDDLIEELNTELYREEDRIIEGKIYQYSDDVRNIINNDKLNLYIKIIDDIFDILYINKDDNIATILYNFELLDEQEKLLNFINDNEEEVLKYKKGNFIIDFINSLSENSFNKSFIECIEAVNLGNIDFFLLIYDLKRIINKIIL